MEKVAPSGGETSQNMIPNVTNANQNVSSMPKSETKLDDSLKFSKKQHPCTSCELSFDTKDELSAHLIEKHGYRRTYQCPICKKKFATKEAIKKHVVENHKANDSKKSAEEKTDDGKINEGEVAGKKTKKKKVKSGEEEDEDWGKNWDKTAVSG